MRKRRFGVIVRKGLLRYAVAGSAVVGALLVAGCANPGPAKPPSLDLPEIASGLTAERVGDTVRLEWRTPERTTDHLPLKGTVTAEVCRESGAAAMALVAAKAPVAAGPETDKVARAKPRPVAAVGAQACTAVTRMAVQPGASEASDALPAELASGQAGLVAYRVQLRNAAGKTAGPSGEVFVPSGPAPAMVKGLRGRADKAGAVLEWQAASGAEDVVELERRTVAGDAGLGTGGVSAGGGSSSGQKNGAAGPGKAPADVRFKVGGAVDAGGAVDRTAKIGETYLYTATRVRKAVVDGQSVEVRSGSSAEVKVEVADVFPPERPVGLVASPGFVRGGDGAAEHAAIAPAIDLSWEPSVEARVVGYRVYRRIGDSGEWVRLNAELVAVPAYRDATVEAGTRYGYRVTAVDTAGHESEPGNVVGETGPGQ